MTSINLTNEDRNILRLLSERSHVARKATAFDKRGVLLNEVFGPGHAQNGFVDAAAKDIFANANSNDALDKWSIY